MDVVFRSVYPWAILPDKAKVDVKAKRDEVRMVEENFRWVRASRSAELCWPWRVAHELGWVIRCPVDITMDALNDVETACPPEHIPVVARMTNSTEYWEYDYAPDSGRQRRVHFTRGAGWLALYDFRVGGHVQRMFHMNGQGSVEWVMGWGATIPPTYSLLILPGDPVRNLEVITGIHDAKTLGRREGKDLGLSIAVRPTGPVTLRRGQPIARLILLHPDSLRARATVEGEEAPTKADPAEAAAGGEEGARQE